MTKEYTEEEIKEKQNPQLDKKEFEKTMKDFRGKYRTNKFF